jgi:hypothetical protein
MSNDRMKFSKPVDRAAGRTGRSQDKAMKPTKRVNAISALPAVRTLGLLTAQGLVAADVKEAFETDVEVMFGKAP